MYKLIDWPVFANLLNTNSLFLFSMQITCFLKYRIQGMTSLFGFAGEIDFTYGAIDKSDETECGYIKLNS